MKKLLFLLLFSINCLANPISDDFCHTSSCEVAINNATSAFLIQTGAQNFINMFQNSINNELTKVIRKTGQEKTVTTTLVLYKIIKTREINFRLLKKNWTVGTNYIKLNFNL